MPEYRTYIEKETRMLAVRRASFAAVRKHINSYYTDDELAMAIDDAVGNHFFDCWMTTNERVHELFDEVTIEYHGYEGEIDLRTDMDEVMTELHDFFKDNLDYDIKNRKHLDCRELGHYA